MKVGNFDNLIATNLLLTNLQTKRVWKLHSMVNRWTTNKVLKQNGHEKSITTYAHFNVWGSVHECQLLQKP